MSESELRQTLEMEKLQLLLELEKIKARFAYAGLFFDMAKKLLGQKKLPEKSTSHPESE